MTGVAAGRLGQPETDTTIRLPEVTAEGSVAARFCALEVMFVTFWMNFIELPDDAVAVVKFQEYSLARELPTRSFTPLDPPWTITVYSCKFTKDTAGVSVANCVTGLYETVADTGLFPGSKTLNVPEVIVVGSIGSLKVTVTFAPGFTPVVPLAGEIPLIVGGEVSMA